MINLFCSGVRENLNTFRNFHDLECEAAVLDRINGHKPRGETDGNRGRRGDAACVGMSGKSTAEHVDKGCRLTYF